MNEDILEQAHIDAANYAIQLADDLAELQQDERFQRIFQEKFIDAWSITNTMNIATYDSASKQRAFEKMNARGIFCKFCMDIHEDGRIAREGLAELASSES